MTTVNQTRRIVVLGMGNVLLSDEGIGVHIADAMKEVAMPRDVNVEVVDGGTLPDAAISVGDVDKLVIVDAVKGGREPGAVYRFRPEDIKLDNEMLTSLHQISLLEELWLADKFGKKPKEVVIIGIEPEDMELGLELSTRLREKVPQIIDLVLKEVTSGSPDDAEKGD